MPKSASLPSTIAVQHTPSRTSALALLSAVLAAAPASAAAATAAAAASAVVVVTSSAVSMELVASFDPVANHWLLFWENRVSSSPQVFLFWIKALCGFAAGTFFSFNTFPPLSDKMKHIAAYLLLTLGGKESPSAADIKALLETVGVEAEQERLDKLIEELNGKDINTLIAEGQEKL
ncbi:60S acidic ribosomal protein P2, partial [Moesziomyces antarcticus T-34]